MTSWRAAPPVRTLPRAGILRHARAGSLAHYGSRGRGLLTSLDTDHLGRQLAYVEKMLREPCATPGNTAAGGWRSVPVRLRSRCAAEPNWSRSGQRPLAPGDRLKAAAMGLGIQRQTAE
ncbi:hypothetical protein CS0771_45350 [Catellatospora sp. IY07-71]|nr:hypothetical protein CS0771_45350 [Catellatospora sp. IY07-71]